MKIHRFYVKEEEVNISLVSLEKGKEVSILSKELVHQMNTVLRLQPHENIVFFDGKGNEYLSHIVSYSRKSEVLVHIKNVTRNEISFPIELYLFFSLIKKDNVEWILQKGTELGVTHFIPIISTRSEKKDLNIERGRKILIEASEQCGRNAIPLLHPVMKLETALEAFDIPLMVFEQGNEPLSSYNKTNETSLGIFIGPEGGWTSEELDMFRSKKATFRSLSHTTLRAETAAIAATSILLS